MIELSKPNNAGDTGGYLFGQDGAIQFYTDHSAKDSKP